jgi:Mu transposase, C-terminal domain
MATPAARFALAARSETAEEPKAAVHEAAEADPRAVTRRVGHSGKISLGGELYHVGTYLAGETVSCELTEGGLIQVSHRGVLVASHARRRPSTSRDAQRPPRVRRSRSPDATDSVVRLVDTTGYVSFAGTGYWLGLRHRGQQVEVRRVGDTVEIRQGGVLLRAQPARHDRSKEHGAFSTPNGRPSQELGTALRCCEWNRGGGAKLEHGWWDLTQARDGHPKTR